MVRKASAGGLSDQGLKLRRNRAHGELVVVCCGSHRRWRGDGGRWRRVEVWRRALLRRSVRGRGALLGEASRPRCCGVGSMMRREKL